MAKRVPFLGGEKESLHVAPDRHRDAVLWKLEGSSDEDLRRPMTPSGTNLPGLVKHLGFSRVRLVLHDLRPTHRAAAV